MQHLFFLSLRHGLRRATSLPEGGVGAPQSFPAYPYPVGGGLPDAPPIRTP